MYVRADKRRRRGFLFPTWEALKMFLKFSKSYYFHLGMWLINLLPRELVRIIMS